MVTDETEAKLSKIFIYLANWERNTEVARQVLYENEDFNPFQLFQLLDIENKNFITLTNLLNFLNSRGIEANELEVQLLILFYNFNYDGVLSMNEFFNLIRCEESTNPYGIKYKSSKNPISFNIIYSFTKVLEKEIQLARKIIDLLNEIQNQQNFNIHELYHKVKVCHCIDEEGIKNFLDKNFQSFLDSDIKAILKRLDINKDGVVDLCEFHTFLGFPKCRMCCPCMACRCCGLCYCKKCFSDYKCKYHNKTHKSYNSPSKNNRNINNDDDIGDNYINNNQRKSVNYEYNYNPKNNFNNGYMVNNKENVNINANNEFNDKLNNSYSYNLTSNSNNNSYDNLNNNNYNNNINNDSSGKYNFNYNYDSNDIINNKNNNNNRNYNNEMNNNFNNNNFNNNKNNSSYAYNQNIPNDTNNNEEEFNNNNNIINKLTYNRYNNNDISQRFSKKPKRILDNNYNPQNNSMNENENNNYNRFINNNNSSFNNNNNRRSKGNVYSINYNRNDNNNDNDNFETKKVSKTLSIRSSPKRKKNQNTLFQSSKDNYNNNFYEQMNQNNDDIFCNELNQDNKYNNNDNNISNSNNNNSKPYNQDEYEENQFNEFIRQMMVSESEIERIKVNLALRPDFNCEDCFRIFEVDGKEKLENEDIKIGLKLLGVFYTDFEIKLFFKRFDLKKRGYINYSDFFDIFVPFQKEYRRMIEERKPNSCCPCRCPDVFSPETRALMKNLLELILKQENNLNYSRRGFTTLNLKLKNIFGNIDTSKNGYFSNKDLETYLKNNKIYNDDLDKDLLFIRLDKNRNGKIDYQEIYDETHPLYL